MKQTERSGDFTKKKKVAKTVLDYLIVLVGTAVYALGVHIFTLPNRIAPGGVTGLATVANALTGLPVGIFTAVINIPLLILGYRLLGRDFIMKTLVSTLSFTLMTDVLFVKIPVYQGNTLLAAIFGGAMIGAGIAVTFIRNGSTGGTDITNRLIQRKFPYVPIGKIVLLSDFVIVSVAMLVFQELEAALYAVMAMFVCSRVLDGIIYGLDIGKMVLIVSERYDEIANKVTREIKRGCTMIPAQGAYSGQDRKLLLCALRNNEFYKVKQLVNGIDPHAFIIVTNAGEVLGEGFKNISA